MSIAPLGQRVTAPVMSGDARGQGRQATRGERLRRVGVFVVGLLLNLLGAAAWLLSVLLTAPLVLAGVWVWSREFHWAQRLLTRVRRWAGSLWRRAKAHPLAWGVTTVASIGGTTTTYWLILA